MAALLGVTCLEGEPEGMGSCQLTAPLGVNCLEGTPEGKGSCQLAALLGVNCVQGTFEKILRGGVSLSGFFSYRSRASYNSDITYKQIATL